MKKALLLFPLLLVLFFTLPAQITHDEADSIVIERINSIAPHCDILYAKEELQTNGITITTSTEEELELDYSCWIYYTSYAGNNKYLIVKESNGNLLEINTTNDEGLEDLAIWRVVSREILFDVPIIILYEDYTEYTEYPLSSPCWEHSVQGPNSSELIIINSHEELEQFITCTNYPEIDFSQHTLLLTRGKYNYCILWITHHSLQQFSTHSYMMNIRFRETGLTASSSWAIPIIINKITGCDSVELIVTYTYGP